MKTKYVSVVAMLALFSFIETSSADGGRWMLPAGGGMRATVGLSIGYIGYSICYDFTFRLSEDSDGIYPAAEVVEIEVPIEPNPDSSASSAFVISIPPGSFQGGPSGFFMSWNPLNLEVGQQHNGSTVWDFVETEGRFTYPGPSASGVRSFWGWIHQRDVGEAISMRIKMRTGQIGGRDFLDMDFLELLFGAPILRIGNDEWKSYLNGWLWGFPAPRAFREGGSFAEGPCSNFLTAESWDQP